MNSELGSGVFRNRQHWAHARASSAFDAFRGIYFKLAIGRRYRRHRAYARASPAPNAFLRIYFICHFFYLLFSKLRTF